MSFDSRAFRNVLGQFASGVTVVTYEVDGEVHGMTVSAFLSVSLDPPLVLASIDRRARLHAHLGTMPRFGVSVLAAEQVAVSDRFAGRPGMPDVTFTREEAVPLVSGALAWMVCEGEQVVEAGDHALYIGRVIALGARDGAPLLYWKGGYRELKLPE